MYFTLYGLKYTPSWKVCMAPAPAPAPCIAVSRFLVVALKLRYCQHFYKLLISDILAYECRVFRLKAASR